MNSFDAVNHIKSFIDPEIAFYYYNRLISILENKMYHLKLRNGKELKSRLVYHYDDSENIEEIEQLKELVRADQKKDIIGIFINLFRPNSKDYLPYHTDSYDYQTVFTISLGDINSSRNIRFRNIKNTKVARSYYQKSGDAHSFPLHLNETMQHGIPTRNEKLSGRMSVVFFCGNTGYNHLSCSENRLVLDHINTGYLQLTEQMIKQINETGEIKIDGDDTLYVLRFNFN